MAENSAIDWTDDTLNGWIGCVEVRIAMSADQAAQIEAAGGVVYARTIDGRTIYSYPSECDNCYAKVQARGRMGYNDHDAAHPVVWGDPHTTPRHLTKYWPALMPKLEALAASTGRRLVFSFSLSDIFEHHEQVVPWRERFLALVEECPNLDFQLLTKRPQNVHRMVPGAWLRNWPEHVWIGTSAGTQAAMDRRAPYLSEMRAWGAPVAFLSMEPLLERTDPTAAIEKYGVNWIITGGESGAGTDRPRIDANPDWFRHARDVAVAHRVAFFHKQSGGPKPGTGKELDGRLWHQFPNTDLGQVGGVRADASAQLIRLPLTVLA